MSCFANIFFPYLLEVLRTSTQVLLTSPMILMSKGTWVATWNSHNSPTTGSFAVRLQTITFPNVPFLKSPRSSHIIDFWISQFSPVRCSDSMHRVHSLAVSSIDSSPICTRLNAFELCSSTLQLLLLSSVLNIHQFHRIPDSVAPCFNRPYTHDVGKGYFSLDVTYQCSWP